MSRRVSTPTAAATTRAAKPAPRIQQVSPPACLALRSRSKQRADGIIKKTGVAATEVKADRIPQNSKANNIRTLVATRAPPLRIASQPKAARVSAAPVPVRIALRPQVSHLSNRGVGRGGRGNGAAEPPAVDLDGSSHGAGPTPHQGQAAADCLPVNPEEPTVAARKAAATVVIWLN